MIQYNRKEDSESIADPIIVTMSFMILSPKKRSYSVDRLRVVYTGIVVLILFLHFSIIRRDAKPYPRYCPSTDLLQHIDVANEDLGRRGIDEVDATMHKKSMRFSLRRKVIPSNNNDTSENEFSDAQDVFSPGKEERDLAAAFRLMAATRSPDKEGHNLIGATTMRDDASVSAMTIAKRIEQRVVELIQNIGEIIVNAEQNIGADRESPDVRSDPVFEYFCEKNILSLLVDIAKEVRLGNDTTRLSESSFHGVVWSPLVKAQVLKTTSLLISDIRNHSVLFYLLSHNYINDLIKSLLPLQQWTDPALQKMIPAYVDLLKNLTKQLSCDPHLFPFLAFQDTKSESVLFPLFSGALETATSTFAQSDSVIYGTCLAVAVNIMQISHKPIQRWVDNAGAEQRKLTDHLCQRLLERFYRIAKLTTGLVVDGVRSNAIAGQLAGLHEHLVMINEVFWSDVRGLDVRLCESLLQKVVTVLLRNLLPTNTKGRPFLVDVGILDGDVIPESEALAQVSTIFLAHLFSVLTYVPFQRMLAVALLHKKSTSLLSSLPSVRETNSADNYILMPALSDIVNGEESTEVIDNAVRIEIMKSLSGDYGDWRTIATSCLLQHLFNSEAIDDESLAILGILSSLDQNKSQETELEHAITSFLSQQRDPSPVATRALEFVGHLGIQVIQRILMISGQDQKPSEDFVEMISEYPVWVALLEKRNYFSSEAQKCQKITGVSDLFLDLVEAAICSKYTARYNESGTTTFAFSLSQRGCAYNSMDSELLVRKFRGVTSNDVETSRFFINMALHYSALCKVVGRFCFSLSKQPNDDLSSNDARDRVNLDLTDKADLLTRTIGGLSEKPSAGANLDLTGRMTFRFQSSYRQMDSPARPVTPERGERIRNLSEDIGVFRSRSPLMLVLDPTDIFVVKPMAAQMEANRGTVLCSISLRKIIAAASDGEWLHIAVRHEDVAFLIKNGKCELHVLTVHVDL